MTLKEAIQRCDETKPNPYTVQQKVYWLSQVESTLQKELYDLHCPPYTTQAPFDETSDLQTLLSAPEPYDTLYVRYLQAQIDYANGELERYNGAAALFNSAYLAYGNAYHRTHMPNKNTHAEVT